MFGIFRRLLGFSGQAKEQADDAFPSSVVDVTFKNRDNSKRQKIIEDFVHRGMRLVLVADDTNRHDKNAVAVMTDQNQQIGHLNARLAADVRKWWSQNKRVHATVTEVTGGAGDKEYYGVNIEIEIFLPPKA